MPPKKRVKENLPTPKEMTAHAREYIKSYLDTVDEKAPEHLPPMAQQAPFHIEICVLPNGCFGMVLESAPEMRIRASFRGWDDLQNIIVKGVDHFLGFYPHEMKGIADWKKRGRRDAIRDIRVLSESKLGKAAGRLSTVIDEISRMAASNPWLAEKANEQIQMLRDVEEKLRRGFAPADSIAALQDLKAYKPTYEKMIIEFPDKALLERILDGVEELISIQGRMDVLENRMFEVERISTMKSSGEDIDALKDRIDGISTHLEKFSNIVQMLNAKVENYFSKTAEAKKQTDLENRLGYLTDKTESLIKIISETRAKQDTLGENLDTELSRLLDDIEKTRKRVKRLERHFVDLAKAVEES